MMPLKLVMTVLCFTALSCAEYDTLGSCMLNPFANVKGGTNKQIKKVTAMGEMAVVFHDLGKNEKDFKCIRMTLNAKQKEYSIKYIDGSDTEQVLNGTLKVVKDWIFLGVGGKNVYYKLKGLRGTGLFNDGELYPMFAATNELILKGCRTKLIPPVYATSTYFLQPLERATQNHDCKCDWGSL